MKIGIIGAGFVGRAIAKLARISGHQVMLSNSRGPQTLFSISRMFACEIGSVNEVIKFGDVVIVAIPLSAINELPSKELSGKHIIDAVNYYPERDGVVDELDTHQTTTSELLAQHLSASKITKAFNAIPMTQLETDGLPAGAFGRRALPLAGDDSEGKSIAASLYEEFGFDAVDAGSLREGWRFERDMPAYCVSMTKEQLMLALENAVIS